MDIEKLFNVAVDEMRNQQYEEAAKHFDMVVIEAGNHPDAHFYRAYCKCHVGRLGDIPNQAVLFTNAFYKYVDSLAALPSQEEKERKMDDAVKKLSELTSYFSSNGSRTMFTAPSVGLSINNAAKRMSDSCANKIKMAGIKVNATSLEQVNKSSTENKNGIKVLIGIIALGVVAWLIYEIVTWIQIGNLY